MPLAPAFPARWFDGLLRAHALRQTIRALTDRMKSHIVKSMPYQFEHGRIYRMPAHFGPAPSPRQIPSEVNADPTRNPRKRPITVNFLTEASPLERHIPNRFALAGDPVVTVEFHYMNRHRLACRPWRPTQMAHVLYIPHLVTWLGHVAIGTVVLGTAVFWTVVGKFVHGRKSGSSDKPPEPAKPKKPD